MSGIEQPENETRLRSLLNALPLRSRFLSNSYYDIPVDPDIVEGGLRAQDIVPVNKAHRGEYAVECDDGAFIAAARVTPANLSTADEDVWSRKVNRLASIVTSAVNFDAQMVEVMRAVDFRDRLKTYSERTSNLQQQALEFADEVEEEGDSNYESALAAKTLADISNERTRLIKENNETSLVREHYVVVKAEATAAAQTASDDRGGITNIPYLGEAVAERRVQNQRESDQHTEIMLDLIRQRLDSVVRKLNTIDDISATQLSSVTYSQVIADYYQTANIYANAEFNSLIREAPAPGEFEDPEYDIDHDVDTREANSRWINSTVTADGGSTAIGGESTVDTSNSPVRQLLDESPVPILNDEERSERFKSLLTPDRIDPTPDPSHITIDPSGKGVHSATVWVAEWPDSPKDGMLEEVFAYEKDGVDVTLSTHLTGLDKQEVKSDLKNKTNSLQAKWEDAERKGHITADRKRRQYEKTKDIKDSLEGSKHGLFEVGCYITVRSTDLDDLNGTIDAIKSRLSEEPAHARGIRADYSHLEGFRSTAPVAEDHLDRRVRMRGDGLASLFPYSNDNLNEAGGIEIGSHAKRQEPTILNIFDDKHRSTGYDFGIIGKKGSGKTISMGEVIHRQKMKFPATDVVVIDPLQEYAGLCEVFDGNRVIIGGDTSINPFHIEPTPPEKLAKVGRNTPYKDAIRRDMDFVESYYKLEGFKDFSDKRGTWERAIKIAHERKGITINPSTHDNESPTLLDVRQVFVDMASDAKDYVDDDIDDVKKAVDDRQDTAIQILNNDLEPFSENGKYEHLTKQTDLEMGGSGFLYLDLQQYENEQDSGGLMMQLLVSQVYEQAKVHEHPSMLAIDESHYMLRRSASMEALKQASRHGRHYDLSLGFGTHSLKEFFDESGEGNETQLTDNAEIIINNMAFMLFLFNDEMNEEWAGELGLSEEEMEYIQDAMPGNEERGHSEALLKVDEKGCYPLHIEMSMDKEDGNPREFTLLRYDQANHPDDLHEYLERFDEECEWTWTEGNEAGYASDENDSGSASEATDQAEGELSPQVKSDEPLTAIENISEIEAATLHRAGMNSVGDVIDSDISKLREGRGVSEERAEQLKQNAEEFVTENIQEQDSATTDNENENGTGMDSESDIEANNTTTDIDDDGHENNTGADTDEATDSDSTENAFAGISSEGISLERLRESDDGDEESEETQTVVGDEDEGEKEGKSEGEDTEEATLTDIQQVSEARANILREAEYETVEDVARASEDDLRKIEGVGEVRAEVISESAGNLISEKGNETVAADGGEQ